MTTTVESGVPPSPSLFFSGVAMVLPIHFELELHMITDTSIQVYICVCVCVFYSVKSAVYTGIGLNLPYSVTALVF